MKKLFLAMLALGCLGGAQSAGRVEVGGSIGVVATPVPLNTGDGGFSGGLSSGALPSAQVLVHAPDLMGPIGLRGTVGVSMVWMFPMPNASLGLTYPVYREVGGLQSYVYGGAGTYAGDELYGDFGVEVSHPVGKNLRLTGDFGVMVGSAGTTPKAFFGVKTNF